MKKPLDVNTLPFLHSDIDPVIKATLTVSASTKVPCQCARCQVVYTITFFSVYRQWQARGEYICRPCTARINGTLAVNGLAKRRANSLVKYGVDHYMKLRRNQPAISNLTHYLAGHQHPMHTESARAKLNATNLEKWGVPWTTQLSRCHPTKTSAGENEVRTFLEHTTSAGWPASWEVLQGKELDGYCVKFATAFEYCGLYWHSEAAGKDRDAHVLKHRECAAQHIRLYTIFEDEWKHRGQQIQDFLASQLGFVTTRVAARKTICRPVDTRIAQDFVTAHHIQPQHRPAAYAWGLYYEDQLVSVMTFQAHHRQQSQTQSIVLSRFVSLPGYQIVGGASKLFTHARRELLQFYPAIISWSDNRWSNGNVYEKMGFQVDAKLPPDYAYVKGSRRINKQMCTRRKLGAAAGQTEFARATELGYIRIWDCGKTRWIYRR